MKPIIPNNRKFLYDRVHVDIVPKRRILRINVQLKHSLSIPRNNLGLEINPDKNAFLSSTPPPAGGIPANAHLATQRLIFGVPNASRMPALTFGFLLHQLRAYSLGWKDYFLKNAFKLSRVGCIDVALSLSPLNISSTNRFLNPAPDASFISYRDASLAQNRWNEKVHARWIPITKKLRLQIKSIADSAIAI